MELARLWVEGDGEMLTTDLLAGHPSLAGFVAEKAVAEVQTAFDDYPGGRRNHDLLVVGRTDRGPVVVGIEAKADEAFDRPLKTVRAAAEKRQAKGERTNAIRRLDVLAQQILGRTALDGDEPALSYQLFTATAGTLAAADEHRATEAVLLIHEFLGHTDARKVATNADSLAAFMSAAFGAPVPEGPSWVIELGETPGYPGIAFHMAKLTTHVDPAP